MATNGILGHTEGLARRPEGESQDTEMIAKNWLLTQGESSMMHVC